MDIQQKQPPPLRNQKQADGRKIKGLKQEKTTFDACKNEAPFSDLIIRYQNTTLRDNEDRNKWRRLLWWKERG